MDLRVESLLVYLDCQSLLMLGTAGLEDHVLTRKPLDTAERA